MVGGGIFTTKGLIISELAILSDISCFRVEFTLLLDRHEQELKQLQVSCNIKAALVDNYIVLF